MIEFLDFLPKNRVVAVTDLKAIGFRRIVAGHDDYPAFRLKVAHSKIEDGVGQTPISITSQTLPANASTSRSRHCGELSRQSRPKTIRFFPWRHKWAPKARPSGNTPSWYRSNPTRAHILCSRNIDVNGQVRLVLMGEEYLFLNPRAFQKPLISLG